MFVIPFLFGPSGYSLQAYRSARVDIQDVLDRETQVSKGSKGYDQLVKTLPGSNLKTTLQPFFDRMGIRKDLIVFERMNPGFCSAQGTNFFTKGEAAIWVTPKFQDVDQEACHWLIKHEVSHIKNNDCFTMPLVPAICTIATATFSTFMMPVIPVLLVTTGVGMIAHALFSRYREGKADDLAIAESSPEELKGGRRFFMSLKASCLESRKTILQKIFTSSTGELRLDLLHPSTASRLRKIEQALKQQNIEIDEHKELEKVNKLKNLISETALELEGKLKK